MVEPTSVSAVIAVMPVTPSATPNRAVMIGRPAATREPKVRISTSSATATPMSSELPPSSIIPTEPEPLASTVRPASRPCSITSWSASIVAGSTSATVSTSKSQVMVPTRPSSESVAKARASACATSAGVPLSTACWTIWSTCSGPAVAGLARAGSAGICGSCPRSATRSSTALEYVGSVRSWPSGAATTTFTVAWSKASTAPGKSSACRSAAFSDGMPGIENASVIGLDSVAATVPTVSIAISQAARKRGQRR